MRSRERPVTGSENHVRGIRRGRLHESHDVDLGGHRDAGGEVPVRTRPQDQRDGDHRLGRAQSNVTTRVQQLEEQLGAALTPAAPRLAPTDPVLDLNALLGKTLAEIEQLVIEETIAMHGGSVPKAARVLDVSPSTLYRKRESWAKSGTD